MGGMSMDDSGGRRGRSRSKLIPGRNSHSLVRLRKLKPQSLSGNSPLFVSRGVTGQYGDGVPGGGRPVTHPHLSTPTGLYPTYPSRREATKGERQITRSLVNA